MPNLSRMPNGARVPSAGYHASRGDALPGCVTISSWKRWKGATVEVCRHDPPAEVRLCFSRPGISLSLRGRSVLRVRRCGGWVESVYAAGDMEITPAYLEHWGKTYAHAHVAVRFEPAELLQFFGLTTAERPVPFTPHLQDPECRQLLELLHRAVLRLPAGSPLYAEGLIVALGARVFGEASVSGPNDAPAYPGVANGRDPLPEKFRELQRWVDAHLDEEITLEAMAAQVGLNPHQLVRAFRRWRQTSPYGFVVSRRVALVKELLCSTTLAVGEIAFRAGFFDQSHLSRHFKRETGTSPRRYRSTHCG